MRFTKGQRNQFDINTALAVVDALKPFLVKHEQYQDTKGELEENVRLSAEATFHNATTKLDVLIARIGNHEGEEELEKAELELRKAQLAGVEDLKKTQAALRSPSSMLRPEVGRHKNGKWAAFYGDSADPDAVIIGVGDSLAEAMADFDKAFHDKTPVPAAVAPTKGKKK